MITIDGDVGFFARIFHYNRYYPDLHRSGLIAQYESRVVLILQRIRSTRTGRALLDSISKPITIIPTFDPTVRNATAGSSDILKSAPKGARLHFHDTGNRVVEYDEAGEVVLLATGEGSTSTIRFTPDTWTVGSPVYPKYHVTHRDGSEIIKAGHSVDEILFHELVHAVRQGHGRSRFYTSMGDDFDNEEEFCATLLANIYSSELGNGLRPSHRMFEAMPKADGAPTVFYDRYSKEIARCVMDIPQLSQRIRDIDCPFNPIREHFLYSMPWLGPVFHRERRPHR